MKEICRDLIARRSYETLAYLTRVNPGFRAACRGLLREVEGELGKGGACPSPYGGGGERPVMR